MRKCYGCFEDIRDDLEVCPFCGYIEGTPPEEAVHMEPGTILAERYVIGRVLGYGGFGVTYIGWDAKLEQKVAIKEYLPSEFSTRIPGQSRISVFNGTKNEQFLSGLNKFVDEAKRLSKFQKEDGIVKIFDCIAENDTAYIIMEYLEGETLAERLKRDKTIPEKEAIEIMMPVMKSLEIVHREGIIHRDIAPDNIFLTKDGHTKLIDFGAARFATTSHSRSLTVIIKPGFSAEEQYRSRSDQGPHTDVYAVAATLYKMMTGETPPDALERRAKIENAKRDILTEPHKINKNISLITENAVLNALNIQIEDRTPTIEKFIEDLTAPEPVKRIYGRIKIIDLYRMPLWLKILAPSLMVVFLVFGILLATGVIKFKSLFKTSVDVPEGYTIVPNIEGLKIDSATEKLTNSNLNYKTGGNVTSDYISANLIVYQNPESGRIIPINSLIEITVSKGSGAVRGPINGMSTIPIFVWGEEDAVMSDFKIAGLKTKCEYIFDENVVAGQVIRAEDSDGVEVEAGTEIPEGSLITLFVSKGPEGFSMPNLIGYTEKDAKSALEQLGLIASVTYAENGSVSAGTVFKQSVPADTKVTLGTEVVITVATAPKTTATPKPQKKIFATNTPTPTPTPLPILTVTFDSNGGSSVSSITRTYGETLGSLPTPKKEGHSFSGWIYSGSAVSSSTVVKSNMTVIASWTPNSYTISFDSKGGSSVSSITRNYGEKLGSLSSPSKEGYKFTGWTNNGSSVSNNTVVKSNMSLVANWSILTYTITFDSQGGSSVSSFTRNHGDTLGNLPTPSKEGYDFNGWSFNSSSVSSGTVVKSNMTLVASWTIKTYTIKYDVKGGNPSSYASFTRKHGETLGNLPSPTKDYYKFSGWKSGDTTVSSSTTVKSNMTLTAQWTLKNEWTAWTDWSSTAASEQKDSNGLVIVEVDTKKIPGTYNYQYSRYNSDKIDGWIWSGPWEGTWSGYYCYKYQTKTFSSKLPYKETQSSGGTTFDIYSESGNGSWYWETPVQVTPDTYQYRTRTRIK